MNINTELEIDQQIEKFIQLGIISYFEKYEKHVSKTLLSKILYATNKELTNDNPLKNSIHFNWYMYGPYPEQKIILIEKLVNDESIIDYANKENFKKSLFVNKYFVELYEKLNKTTILLSGNFSEALEKFYKLYAPYDFYISFNMTFKNKLDDYFKNSYSKCTSDDLHYCLNMTIGDLPSHPSFSKFKQAYCDFIDILLDSLKSDLNDESKKSIKKQIKQVLQTYGKGVRILQHDHFYDSYVEQWRKDFENSINTMEENTDKLFNEYTDIKERELYLIKLSDLIEKSYKLRSENKLEMVSFYPSNNIPNTNDGSIDAEIFFNLSEKEFKLLLNKFKNSHNASIHYIKNNEFKTCNYRLISS